MNIRINSSFVRDFLSYWATLKVSATKGFFKRTFNGFVVSGGGIAMPNLLGRLSQSAKAQRLFPLLIGVYLLVCGTHQELTAQVTNPIFSVPPISFSDGGQYASGAVMSDFNHDGKLDLVIDDSYYDNSCSCALHSVIVLLGNGNASFQAPVKYSPGIGFTGNSSVRIVVGDFNRDGNPDLAVGGHVGPLPDDNRASVAVLIGNGNGTFRPAVSYPSAGLWANSLAVGDFNKDGKPDLAVLSDCADRSNGCTTGVITVLPGNGDGTFGGALSLPLPDLRAQSIAVGDANRDGKADLLVAIGCDGVDCLHIGSLDLLLGNGDGTFQPAVFMPFSDYADFVALGDVNSDGNLDTAFGLNYIWSATRRVSVTFGNGDGSFQPPVYPSTACAPTAAGGQHTIVLTDVNGDGNLDLLDDCPEVLLGNGDGTFQSPQEYGQYSGEGKAIGDLNGDGKPDFVLVNGDQVLIFLNKVNGFRYATDTSIIASVNPGQVGKFTANVTPAFFAGAVSGSITFRDGENALATVAVVKGRAILSTNSLAVGKHSISATYNGDSKYLRSTSPVVEITIEGHK